MFDKDWAQLNDDDKARFRSAVEKFIADLSADAFRPGLRVKGIEGATGVFEMSWAPDGRATWQYGSEVRAGETHIMWRRIGTHDVFRQP